jgi:hypothetical protein
MAQLFETETRPITDQDRIKLGTELAAVDQRLAEVKAEKSGVSKVYGGRIRELEQKVEVLARQLADGVVFDQFEIDEAPDDARQMIEIWRKDTNRLVRSRPMNEGEKAESMKRQQTRLPFDADGVVIEDNADESERLVPRRSDVVPKAGRGRQKKAGTLASAARRPRKQA